MVSFLFFYIYTVFNRIFTISLFYKKCHTRWEFNTNVDVVDTFDEVHVETAVAADYTLNRVGGDGRKSEVSRGSLGEHSSK